MVMENGMAKYSAKRQSKQLNMKAWFASLSPERKKALNDLFFGNTNGSVGLKDIMIAVCRNYIHYLDSNPDIKPLPIQIIGKEIMATYYHASNLIEKKVRKEKLGPVFISEELRQLTKKHFSTAPKQVRGAHIDNLLATMSLELGAECFTNLRLIDLKKYALDKHNINISTKAISNNHIYKQLINEGHIDAETRYPECIQSKYHEVKVRRKKTSKILNHYQ